MERFDSKNIYCRMLGHAIPFSYCRLSTENLPCRKILDCWFETIPVEKFIEENYTGEERERIFSPAPAKVSTILDLIEKAKQRTENSVCSSDGKAVASELER